MPYCATFRRDVGALSDVFGFIGDFCSAELIDVRFRRTLEFAVEEIFVNCIKHNSAGASGIDIQLSADRERVKVAVTDSDAAPFDINSDAPQVRIDEPLEERQPGGLGVHLVKKMMDGVEYTHEGRVSTITLYKNLR